MLLLPLTHRSPVALSITLVPEVAVENAEFRVVCGSLGGDTFTSGTEPATSIIAPLPPVETGSDSALANILMPPGVTPSPNRRSPVVSSQNIIPLSPTKFCTVTVITLLPDNLYIGIWVFLPQTPLRQLLSFWIYFVLCKIFNDWANFSNISFLQLDLLL